MYRVFIQSLKKVSPSWVHYTQLPNLTPVDFAKIAEAVSPQFKNRLDECIKCGDINGLQETVTCALIEAGYRDRIRFYLVNESDNPQYLVGLHTFRFASLVLNACPASWIKVPENLEPVYNAILHERFTHNWPAYNIHFERMENRK